MKKVLFSFIIFIMIFAFTACGESKSDYLFSDETKSLNNQVVYDKNNVKVVATKIKYHKDYGPVIIFEAENNTDEGICVETGNLSVNDLGVSGQLYMEVKAKDTGIGELELFENDIALCHDITEIGVIRFNMRISDKTCENTIDISDFKEIVVNENVKTTSDTKGDVIFSEKGVTVYTQKCKAKDTDELDYITKLYIKNETDNNLIVSLKDVYVNGAACYPYCFSYVPANKNAYRNLYFYKGEFKENGIDKPENIELTISVWNHDAQAVLVNSNMIMLSAD